jgi:hypothetical protein
MPDRKKMIRAADAKEVGVGNPAEETYRHPNQKAVVIIGRELGHVNPPADFVWVFAQVDVSRTGHSCLGSLEVALTTGPLP